ncbi:HD-GYP domain-containing protein [Eubacteriales bacterium OttesenSCG-928-N13]|nr:HD-GYP domain-containing protein [Eubacteriales bacterium OttesenSCG-928-N13]
MTKSAKRFAYVLIILGTLGAIYSVHQYVLSLQGTSFWNELQIMICLVIMCTICRSLPIYINPNYALDVSILSIVAAVLVHGPYAAVVVSLISTLFSFSFDDDTHALHHLYNTSILKSAFNSANLVMAILLPGMLIVALGFEPGQLVFPHVLLSMVIFTLFTFLVNLFNLQTLFILNGATTLEESKSSAMGLIPNVLAAMPLGLFTAVLFMQENGYWMAVVMLLPLLLARHAWKLYLDSQVQYMRLIDAFISSMEAKDKYTEGHSIRVSEYSVMIASGLGLNPNQIETIKIAAMLHDIGKIGIADSILQKPSRLTDEEYAVIKTHPQIGVNIVSRVGLPQEVIEIIRHHHERYDGTGYPDGLPHLAVSLGAQILSVADSYDAMTSARTYRREMPQQVAFEQMIEGKGTQFNPKLVDVLIHELSKQTKLEEKAA